MAAATTHRTADGALADLRYGGVHHTPRPTDLVTAAAAGAADLRPSSSGNGSAAVPPLAPPDCAHSVSQFGGASVWFVADTDTHVLLAAPCAPLEAALKQGGAV